MGYRQAEKNKNKFSLLKLMRKIKKNLIRTRYTLNTIDEIVDHILSESDNYIDLDECKINHLFDFRIILSRLKEDVKFRDKINIRNDINEFGFEVFYCILKIPLRCETTVFTKGAFFELIEFEKYVQFIGAVFESEYSFQKSVFHSSVNLSTVDFETTISSKHDLSFYRTIFKKDVSFFMTHFHNTANFRSAIFHEGLDINYAEFTNIDLSNIEMKGDAMLINYHTAIFLQVNNRETGLYLKQHALKMQDSVNVLYFKKLEMEAYRKTLLTRPPEMEIPAIKRKINNIKIQSDLLILWLSKWSNSYGNSFLLGILFTLTVWFIFFSWFIVMRDGIGSTFIWTDKRYLYEAVNYIWLFNGIGGLSVNNSVTWGCIFPFFIGKIFITFGIYQTIVAFRKYSK